MEPGRHPSPNLAELRREYAALALSETDVDPDPVRQLARWIEDAVAAKVLEPSAMTLATTDGTRPSARVVLLKNLDADGLVFFTNYHSRKARQLDAHPHASVVFYWPELERQARVDGTVSRLAVKLSDEYFVSRPPPSRVGAAASPQSQVISSRAELERLFAETAAKYPDGNVPRPAHWGGYLLRPATIEFWQGRPSRLHDRIEFSRSEENPNWVIRRLAP